MKSNRIIIHSSKALTNTEKCLLTLLTKENATKDDVIEFLKHYDIDFEIASTTFLINDLLDRFDIQKSDNPTIPRIRGLSEFFRFQNATILMNHMTNEVIFDTDFILKILYPNTIRPIHSCYQFLEKEEFVSLAGMKFANKLINGAKKVKMLNKEFLIPPEQYLLDIIYLGLYRSIKYNKNRENAICYIYDIYRYCNEMKLTNELQFSIQKTEIRHMFGRVKRWFLKLIN